MTALSKTGERQLAEAEQIIEAGLATFMEVGNALVTIREGRLYRADHDTFEDYCLGRWGFTARRANQLITAAQIGTTVPVLNEAQARSLTSLRDDEDALAEAWQRAEEAGDTTAAGLATVVHEMTTTDTTTTTFDPETGEIVEGGDEPGAGEVVPEESAAPPSSTTPPPAETLEERSAREAEESRLSRNVNFGKYLIGMFTLLGDGDKPVRDLIDGWVPEECPSWLVEAHQPVFTPDGIRAVASVMEKLASEWESRV